MQLNRLTILALVAMLIGGIAGSSYAKDGERLTNLIQLCIEDKSTGFNWEKGNWRRVNFVPEKFVVTKITLSQDGDSERYARVNCEDVPGRRDGLILEGYAVYQTCLSFQQMGSGTPTYMDCWESHIQNKENKYDWAIRLECRGGFSTFNFNPNGSFIRSVVHADTGASPENDYKDSLVIGVGKCADITG